MIHKPGFIPMQATSFQVHRQPRPARTLVHNSRLGILRLLLTFLQGWRHILLEILIHNEDRVILALFLFFLSLAELERDRRIWLALLLLFRLGLGRIHTKEEQSRYKATKTTTRKIERTTRTSVKMISFVFMLSTVWSVVVIGMWYVYVVCSM